MSAIEGSLTDREILLNEISWMAWPLRFPSSEQKRALVIEISDADELNESECVHGNVVIVRIEREPPLRGIFQETKKHILRIGQIDRGNVGESELVEAPPVGDPHEYYADVRARGDISLRLMCSARMHAEMYANLFDTPPDPDLIDAVILNYHYESLASVTCIPHNPVSPDDELELRYFRNNMESFHEFVRSRTDTLVGVELEFGEPHGEGFTLRHEISATNFLSDVAISRELHTISNPRNQSGDLRERSLPFRVHTEGEKIRVILVKAVCNRAVESIAKKMEEILHRECTRTTVYDPNSVYRPKQNRSIIERARTWCLGVDWTSRLAKLSWHYNHKIVMEIVIALAPLNLPPYVVLWILQKISVFYNQREVRMIRLIDGVTQSCQRAVIARSE